MKKKTPDPRSALPDIGSDLAPVSLNYPLVGYRIFGVWIQRNPEITSGPYSGWFRVTDPQRAEYLDSLPQQPQ